MTGSHTVDLLSSGFVVKTAISEMFNGKLKAEVDQIRALHDIYPELMVPVLHDGLAAGRQFYILEKKDALPLSEIVFDEQRSLAERRMIVHHALGGIQKAIGIEMNSQSTPANDMPARLLEEWEGIRFAHELFDRPILLDGVQFGMTARDVFEKALVLARTEKFSAVEKAHFNFHFGNVLYNEGLSQVSFIDPDFSVRGIDPYFGFSRFAFSFWHELATETEDAVKMVPMSDALMFVLRKRDYGDILSEIPEIGRISGLLPWVDESVQRKFYVLTTYCFLRSIRINGSKETWKQPRLPSVARPEEVLMLGLLAYLEGPGIDQDSTRA
ncbi:hypothetical protein ACS0X5_02545 [Burkholderia gladioli]|uniref:Aminoglycoside phosphotransferase domain-containing protein n=1 Tax=Burkholderia gladioli (strain BSR3) TaxID=999541 RepID=F2LI78_BURGS|nr:hypothetical protein [Burkholderia gladioli]AEA62744.1 hypothetical protein bgla_2g02680 [Burkholderia gladioli BSR3]MBW5280558.1 hypothetical protein [Burkholderia gladioli]NHH78792.1 hypothetical protein [Burkholderia gladioli]CAG9201128.1 conserved hypothetical protein [Burkholderia gladioli]